MRISVLSLILLFVPAVKIKEACKTRRQQISHGDVSFDTTDPSRPLLDETDLQQETVYPEDFEDDISEDVKPLHDFDLLIVGAGLQTWKSLTQFSNRAYEKKGKFRIGIVEKKPKLGHGLPYDNDVVIPEHLLNFFEAVVRMPELEKYVAPIAIEIDETVSAYEQVVLMHPPPRYAEGEYLVETFNDFVTECEYIGYKIDLMPNTTAVNIERAKPNGFAVTLSGKHKGTFTTTDIFLSTGHWYRRRFDTKVDGYFKSPWPASKLKNKITEPLHIAIFGCGLSAIDAALTLAHKFGRFVYRDKRFHFEIKLEYQSGHFKITMYCRSGHFPPVAAIPAAELPKDTVFQKANSVKEKGIGSKKFLPLDDVLKLLKEDLAALIPEINTTRNGVHFDEMDAKQLIDHIDFFAYKGKDYKQRLIHDIEEARASMNSEAPLKIPSFFNHIAAPFSQLLEYFSAEDTITFKTYIAPAISKWFAPIPPHNAEKMFALMNASRLFMIGVGDDSKVTADEETKKGVHIHHNGQPIYHRYFIDAKGQSGDISKDPRLLTQRLISNRLIQPLYIPYDSNDRGQLDLDNQENPGSGVIKKDRGKYYHKSDGIVMNWKTMHAIPPGETTQTVIKKASKGLIYAFGPFTYRRYALLQSFAIADDLAKSATADLIKRRF